MAVVLLRVVGRVSNNRPKAEAQSKEDLSCSLPPHLDVCPNFQLEREKEREKEAVSKILKIRRHKSVSLLNATLSARTFG